MEKFVDLVRKSSLKDGFADAIVVTDSGSFPLSSISRVDLQSPNRTLLFCTRASYDKHFPGGSKGLAEQLEDSPVAMSSCVPI